MQLLHKDQPPGNDGKPWASAGEDKEEESLGLSRQMHSAYNVENLYFVLCTLVLDQASAAAELHRQWGSREESSGSSGLHSAVLQ